MEVSLWAVHLTKDHEFCIIGGSDAVISIYRVDPDPDPGNPYKMTFVRRLTDLHERSVSHVVVDETRKLMLSGSEDRTVKLYDLKGRKIARQFQTQHHVLCVDFHYPTAVSCSNESGESGAIGVKLWNVEAEGTAPVRVLRLTRILDLKISGSHLVVSLEKRGLKVPQQGDANPGQGQGQGQGQGRTRSPNLMDLMEGDFMDEDSDESDEDYDFPNKGLVRVYEMAQLLSDSIPEEGLRVNTFDCEYVDTVAVVCRKTKLAFTGERKVRIYDMWP